MGELRTRDFDLKLTLESGQFFRYHARGDGYLLLTAGRAITLAQHDDILEFDGADAAFIRSLFQLTPAYASQLARLQRDPVIAPLIRRYPGLRLMRQDLHETIIGFICSSQSNIPKIRMNLHLLSSSCGEEIGGHFHLPRAGMELDHAVVLSAKTGYRAKFLVETNRLLTPQVLNGLRAMTYAESHAALCELPGIGPKIADCVCLFALGHGEAFPVDVHIIRAMRALFPRSRLVNEKRIRAFAQQRWGTDAGLAQQFIYQWARDSLRVERKVLV